MKATDKITGNTVTVIGRADTPRPCFVIQHPDGSRQVQFASLLINFRKA